MIKKRQFLELMKLIYLNLSEKKKIKVDYLGTICYQFKSCILNGNIISRKLYVSFFKDHINQNIINILINF